MDRRAETRTAKSVDAHIAYQVLGDGPIDLVFIPWTGTSDVETRWEGPTTGPLLERLLRFARVITLDKRGTGLSGRAVDLPTFEQQMDDIVAVIDAAGSMQPAMFGFFDGAVLAALFAATHPQRSRALVTWILAPRVLRAADYPWGIDEATFERWIAEAYEGFGLQDLRERINPHGRIDERSQRDLDRVFRLHAGPVGLSASLRMWAGMDIRPVLPSIRVPTLVMHRADATLVPAAVGRQVTAAIPGARYTELPGTNIFMEPGDADLLGDEIEEFLTGTRPLRDPDRVLATVLFTDVVDSTKRAAALGDRRWHELISRHDAIVRQELERFRGDEVKTMGDAFLPRFDGPARAVQSATAIREALRSIDLVVRAGIHTGEIEIVKDDVSGIAVTIGKRIESLAQPGQILVSRTVVDLVAGSGIRFTDRGEHDLKGVPGTWQLFAVAD